MEALMLAAMLSCSDGAWILSGLNTPGGPTLTLEQKNDLRESLIDQMPDNCAPEDYNPPGRTRV